MKLTDLKPAWVKHCAYTHLAFDCPQCRGHRIEVPKPPHPKAWGFTGPQDFAHLTIHPSIMHRSATDCISHFWVQNGEIVMAT